MRPSPRQKFQQSLQPSCRLTDQPCAAFRARGHLLIYRHPRGGAVDYTRERWTNSRLRAVITDLRPSRPTRASRLRRLAQDGEGVFKTNQSGVVIEEPSHAASKPQFEVGERTCARR